jgi:hypothetical protein
MKEKAKSYIDKRIDQTDGSILEIVIWKLPFPTVERPHGYKYRLNYSLRDGTTLVRFVNELGKGDHKHIKGKEHLYKFSTPEQAVLDFISDIKSNGGRV